MADLMRAAIFEGGGRVVAGPWPQPAAGPGELVLRVRGCGLCGSDIAKILAPDTPGPAVLGHEVVGEVVAVGEGGAGFGPGDRVVAAHHVPCGECHYCRRGSESMCRAFKASSLDPGGFAEYVRVPPANVRHATFRIPDHLTDEEASFVEPLACCVRAVDRARVEPGDTAVVVGLGSIGRLFTQLLGRAGAAVVGVDRQVDRVQGARAAGVDAWPLEDGAARARELSGGRGADQVVVTGGAGPALQWAAGVVRDGGQLHAFAGGEGTPPLPLETFYKRELTLTTTYSSSPATLARAFWLLAAGKVEAGGLITHRLPLERLADGVELMRRREALKVYVTP
jgi:L-iditol 2-dehydrogenase